MSKTTISAAHLEALGGLQKGDPAWWAPAVPLLWAHGERRVTVGVFAAMDTAAQRAWLEDAGLAGLLRAWLEDAGLAGLLRPAGVACGDCGSDSCRDDI